MGVNSPSPHTIKAPDLQAYRPKLSISTIPNTNHDKFFSTYSATTNQTTYRTADKDMRE